MSYVSKKPFILTKIVDTETLVTAETLNILSGVIKFQDKFSWLIKIDKNRDILYILLSFNALPFQGKKVLSN